MGGRTVFLPERASLDGWIRRIRNGHDTGTVEQVAAWPAIVVTLPTFAPLQLARHVGALSAWLSWETPTVVVLSAAQPERAVAWQIRDQQKPALSGVVSITGQFDLPLPPRRRSHPLLVQVSGLPEGAGAVGATLVQDERELQEVLQLLAADGLTAELDATFGLQEYVLSAIRSKNARVAIEALYHDQPLPAGGAQATPIVVDAQVEDSIATELLYGAAGQRSESLIVRLLRRAAHGDLLERVPLPVLLRGQIPPAAESAIRRRVGDPHLGRRIRRHLLAHWSAERPLGSVEEFLESWRAHNAGSDLGRQRVLDAFRLLRHGDPGVQAVSLDQLLAQQREDELPDGDIWGESYQGRSW